MGVLAEGDILKRFRNAYCHRIKNANQIPKFYGTPHSAIVNHSYPLARIYMKRTHETGH
jgi:hypothetical protein